MLPQTPDDRVQEAAAQEALAERALVASATAANEDAGAAAAAAAAVADLFSADSVECCVGSELFQADGGGTDASAADLF